jgi:tetratricopeptide (TPR) repeat protein
VPCISDEVPLTLNLCPTDATLARLGDDSFTGSSARELERNVDECASCQGKLDRRVENDAGSEVVSTPRLPGCDEPRIPGFFIERELGRGATSVVYQARQTGLNRRVALKVVRSGPAAGSREHARWMREARSSSRVRHENVVRLYQVGDADGWLYMVLELVQGGTLQDGLNVAYSPRGAARMVATVAGAVAAIHREGLLHLDLKPSNILLDRPAGTPRECATPRVGDFGIASPWNDPDATATMTGSLGPLGTPRYMAPEQIGGDRKLIGPAADLYGLGAIFYQVLTGHPPFSAVSVTEVFKQIQNDEPVPPRRLNPAIPRDLETVCLTSLQKDPGRRYASAEALAADLTRWLDGMAIAARPVSVVEKTWRACRRRPAVAMLGLCLAVTLWAGFLGIFLLWRHAEAQRRQAEADFKIMSDVLGQIVEINAGGDFVPRVAGPESLISSLQQTRERLLEVAASRPDQMLISRHLAFVAKRLGYALMAEGKWDEARLAFHESLSGWERVLRNDPLDHRSRRSQILALRGSAQVAEKKGKLEESGVLLTRALEAAEVLGSSDRCAASICVLADSRHNRARFLARLGDHAAARSLRAANRRMLEEVTVDSGHPEVMAWRIFARCDCDRSSVESSHASASEVGGSGPLSGLASSESDRLPADRWAELIADDLRSAATSDMAPPQTCSAGFNFVLHLGAIASGYRRSGNVEEARRTVDRIHAFARMLVARYPDQSFAHLTVGEAYSQLHKNAWQTDDRVALERNLKLALDATLQSLVLDPKSEIARFLVDLRRRRLTNLLARR